MDKLQSYNKISLLAFVFFISNLTFSQSVFEIKLVKECVKDSNLLELTPQPKHIIWSANPAQGAKITSPDSSLTWVKVNSETNLIADIEFNETVLKETFSDTLNFESDYLYDTNIDKNGYISITPLPNIHFSAWTKLSDHDGNNSMLVADGDTVSGAVYKQSFNSEKDQKFSISIWVANIHRFFGKPPIDTSITKSAGFNFVLNNETVKTYTIPLDTLWHQITFDWIAKAEGMNSFHIINNVNNIKGNDFALDDLEITSTKKEKLSITLSPCNQSPTLSPDGDGVSDTYFIATEGNCVIYDLSGKKIKTLHSPAHWDGTDTNGKIVSSGFYAITVDDQIYGRVTVIK